MVNTEKHFSKIKKIYIIQYLNKEFGRLGTKTLFVCIIFMCNIIKTTHLTSMRIIDRFYKYNQILY